MAGPDRYPQAVPADDILTDIERRRGSSGAFRGGYECLYLAEASTRPSMEFSLSPADLNATDWKDRVEQIVARARAQADAGETVYFDPD